MSVQAFHDQLEKKDSGSVGLESLLNQLRRKSNQEGASAPYEIHADFPTAPANDRNNRFYGQPQTDPVDATAPFGAQSTRLPGNPSGGQTAPGSVSFPSISSPPASMPMGFARPGHDASGSSQLLNLLKFGGSASSTPASRPGPESLASAKSTTPRAPDVQQLRQSSVPLMSMAGRMPEPDIIASLMKGPPKDEPSKPAPAAAAVGGPWTSTAQSNETEQYLLNLLNLSKPGQKDGPSLSTSGEKPPTPQAAAQEPDTAEESASKKTPSSQISVPVGVSDVSPLSPASKAANASKSATKATKAVRSPKPVDRSDASPPVTKPVTAGPPLQILKKPGGGQSADGSKVENVASNAATAAPGPAVEAASAAASPSPSKKAAPTGDDTSAKKGNGADQTTADKSTGATGRVKHPNAPKEESVVAKPSETPEETEKPPEVITIDAAHSGVADSWENADQDADRNEIVVLEEESSPVKVYNLPMKPWISIDVQDDDKESRAQFQDDSLLDIARLKKEFDQIDRNLVAASENYMSYGMSRAGGLRVIRQTDGKDAKLFTDTKDRIFNIGMSANTDDQGQIPKESIIGTGVSGTVYWIQIRDGDKDHLEYTHPELHGFVLPPIISHEGDAPGGVLKTRARTSTSHPEYFAVGRGKSINIVWPFFIMENNLFKPGHDRVVDTEKLSKQCSLKINTGKAGKDFTFSQDDSVIVSLDKSGRVKFWDVRDLTAAKQNSDPRKPLPAHSSLEVKDPLMTLTTTPEGEKAWPTSVLLLDKLRPYQKQCALRYMIVGMKQNHTLQLWDLALGKPVQEFNLPHSKESDAVCSVMYHPPTGMIVVGHPTRNSVYFLHLSAPKYAMKSMSQVEYIERLNAQDPSIPTPESTAVISGIREYSLDNKGALRSLDILHNPASNADGDDPTLFELYAMHSKGVSCMFIRFAELGWTKDSKVIAPVDAIEAGKVAIKKLRASQSPPPTDSASRASESTPSSKATPRIIASRSSSKDSSLRAAGQAQETRKTPETVVLASKSKSSESRADDKVLMTPPTTAPSTDKPEKRNRKKKSAAAAPSDVTGSSDREIAVSNGTPGTAARTVDTNKSGSQQSTAKVSQSIGNDAIDKRINAMETQICERVASSVHVAIDGVKKSIEQQFRARDTDFEEKQSKLLELVSNVLNSNTQQVLSKLIREEFEKSVVPVLRNDVTKSMTEQLAAKINPQVSSVLQKELQKSLPGHVAQGIRSQDLSKTVSDKVAQTVANHVDERLKTAISKDMIPAISAFSTQAVQGIAQDLHSSVAEQMAELKHLQIAQNSNVESLSGLVATLSETVSAMAASQERYQTQLAKLESKTAQAQAETQRAQAAQAQFVPPTYQSQQQYGNQPELYGDSSPRSQLTGSFVSPPSNPTPKRQRAMETSKSPEELEQAEVDIIAATLEDLLNKGKYDEAMMRWLQSRGKEEALFRKVLVNYPPNILDGLQPLVLLSVGSTVTQDLEGPLMSQKLGWVEMVLVNLYNVADQLDDQTREITPNVLMHIRTRLEQTLMHISKTPGNNQSLKTITQMISVINRVADVTKARVLY